MPRVPRVIEEGFPGASAAAAADALLEFLDNLRPTDGPVKAKRLRSLTADLSRISDDDFDEVYAQFRRCAALCFSFPSWISQQMEWEAQDTRPGAERRAVMQTQLQCMIAGMSDILSGERTAPTIIRQPEVPMHQGSSAAPATAGGMEPG